MDDIDDKVEPDDQQFCLRWNNYQHNLCSVFSRLYTNDLFTDVIIAADGKFIKAHKLVLSACSPYFESLFQTFNEKNQIVILKDVEFEDASTIVEFMYKGEINVCQDQLPTLLRTAENLRVKGLADVGGTNDCGSGGGSLIDDYETELHSGVKSNNNRRSVSPPTLSPSTTTAISSLSSNNLKILQQRCSTPSSTCGVIHSSTSNNSSSPKHKKSSSLDSAISPKSLSSSTTTRKNTSPTTQLPQLSNSMWSMAAASKAIFGSVNSTSNGIHQSSDGINNNKKRGVRVTIHNHDDDYDGDNSDEHTVVLNCSSSSSISSSHSSLSASVIPGESFPQLSTNIKSGSGLSVGGGCSPPASKLLRLRGDLLSHETSSILVNKSENISMKTTPAVTDLRSSEIVGGGGEEPVDLIINDDDDNDYAIPADLSIVEEIEEEHNSVANIPPPAPSFNNMKGLVNPSLSIASSPPSHLTLSNVGSFVSGGNKSAQEFAARLGVVKMSDYMNVGTRQQFWDEDYVKIIMQAVKDKELDMKGGAEILGVSYGTLYGRYREVYGYLKHGWNQSHAVSITSCSGNYMPVASPSITTSTSSMTSPTSCSPSSSSLLNGGQQPSSSMLNLINSALKTSSTSSSPASFTNNMSATLNKNIPHVNSSNSNSSSLTAKQNEYVFEQLKEDRITLKQAGYLLGINQDLLETYLRDVNVDGGEGKRCEMKSVSPTRSDDSNNSSNGNATDGKQRKNDVDKSTGTAMNCENASYVSTKSTSASSSSTPTSGKNNPSTAIC